MPYDANNNELEILKFWQKNKIFEKSIEQRPENKPYVFYDGPPFATGLPHYGHILSSVIKDVVPRYFTMKGFRVRRRWGWDCHGLPIEQLIEKELKLSGKKKIETEFGVDKFNTACESKVLMYTHEWKKMVERIGRWVEFDNAYKTMDSTYMESVWWALKNLWDRDFIYEGRKVLLYCPRCETPVSKAEIAMDNSYKDVTEEAVTVKFRVQSSKPIVEKKLGVELSDLPVYILAWTTTPWTLPGNVALAVGPEIEYSVVRFEGAYYIVAKDRLMHIFGSENDEKEFEVVRQVHGKYLAGLEYGPLFDLPAVRDPSTSSGQAPKKAWYVAPADFVTTTEGTGIVHTAVIYGEDDYALGVKIDLPMVPLVDDRGHFNDKAPSFIQGEYFKKAEKQIKEDLASRGLIFSREQNTHSYPHCWRCDTALMYNAISAWFINIQRIKKRLVELNEKINWYPEHLKHGRFLNILKTAPDWNISRNRYWATPLPFWKCQSGLQTSVHQTSVNSGRSPKSDRPKSCDNVTCVGSVAELKKKAINFDEVYKTDEVEEIDLHKHLVDKIRLKCEKCGGEMERIPEVIDCWVESASMPFAEFHYPFENKKVFEKRFPGHYIAEYIAQTRAWFYYMHVLATLLFDTISFENCVTTGTILNDKGEKLSKSKMNYTDPWKIIEEYGVDALRYYLMTSVVMQADDLFFNDREVRDVYNKVVNILWNVVTFYGMYAGDGTWNMEHGTKKSTNVLDRWILAKLQLLVKEVTENMDNYDTVKAGRPIKDFIDELSTWYLRRSRDRFKGDDNRDKSASAGATADKQAALATLREVLLTLAKVMAPFTPFLAETVFRQILNPKSEIRNQKSVHLEEWPKADKKMIDEKVLKEMEIARKVVEMGLSLRKEASVRVRQPLSEFIVHSSEFTDELRQIIADELNVKSVETHRNASVPQGKNWIQKEEGELKVALNVEITDELKKEGLVREIVRAVNDMRKDQKLTIEDRIIVGYATDDALLKSVFKEYGDEIKRGVLAEELKERGGGVATEIDGRKLELVIQKK